MEPISKTMHRKSVLIRNVDKELWLDARMLALAQEKPLYEFVQEALKEKIERCYKEDEC